MTIGAPFKPMGRKPKGLPLPGKKPGSVKLTLPKSLNYQRIEAEVNEAIAKLGRDEQAQIPVAGTLPERMVALALVQLGYLFQAQRAEDGGRLRIGGAVVDFLVYFGAQRVICRVQGSYWHSLPERKRSDAVQAERLRAKKYLLFDLWEHDIYQAWTEGRLLSFVEHGLLNAS